MDLLLSKRPWTGFLAVVMLCHGGMWAVAYFVEGRVLQWDKQFTGFVYGDLLLALAVSSALWANQKIGPLPANHWSRRASTHATVLVAVAAFAIWRWAFNDYPNYSVGQSASPTKLYHDALFVVIGYYLACVVMPLTRRPRYFLIPLAMVAAWASLGIFIDSHDGWKTSYAHTDYEWAPKHWVEMYIDPILKK